MKISQQNIFTLMIYMAVVLFISVNTANAQQSFPVQAFAHNATTLQTKEGMIELWGLDGTIINNSVSGLKARALIDDIIGNKVIQCSRAKASSRGVVARCINAQNQDIALTLVKEGLGVLKRADLQGNSLLAIYDDAERKARAAEIGIWGAASGSSSSSDFAQMAQVAGMSAKDILMLVGVFLGPIIGMLIVSVILYFGFDRMTKLQKRQIMMSQQREKELRDREKFVLAASLESEINTNRAKIDAFVLIYEDMLRNLKDPSKTPKYKQSGDIVHQRPSLSRAVYDANLDRMDLVGAQIFSDLSEVYAKIDPNPDYFTLEPDTPIEQAMDKVQKIIRQANELIIPLDQVNSALSMIIRERKKKVTQPTISPL